MHHGIRIVYVILNVKNVDVKENGSSQDLKFTGRCTNSESAKKYYTAVEDSKTDY